MVSIQIRLYPADMEIGFGRVVVSGVIADDPYRAGLDQLSRFEVISDAGPRYWVERLDHRNWRIRAESSKQASDGTVHQGGNALNSWFSYKRAGRLFSEGRQNMFINAVFGLVGVLDDGPSAARR